MDGNCSLTNKHFFTQLCLKLDVMTKRDNSLKEGGKESSCHAAVLISCWSECLGYQKELFLRVRWKLPQPGQISISEITRWHVYDHDGGFQSRQHIAFR